MPLFQPMLQKFKNWIRRGIVYMNMKKKIKEKLAESKPETTQDSVINIWENARHAIDLIEESGKYYLIVVKYNDLQGQVVSKVSLGSTRAVALRKAGFILGDKVLKNKDINEDYLND